MYTLNSKLRDLYANPAGYDIISKILLQIGIPRELVFNPLVGALPLSFLHRLAGKKLDKDFFNVLLALLNQSQDSLGGVPHENAPAWWKEAVFYQIYPRSFMDGNGDGIGDLSGIITKLDYLKELGVDAVWLSPIYDSPGDDNGYDIRDYRKIDEQFGTMEDFDALLKGLHDRDMRLVMDLVVNHTSDEHRWFQEALQHPDSKYRDYYFLREKPNNWTSFFSGSVWNFYPEQDFWGLHLFSRKQMDLNWDNPGLRSDIYEMIRWWLEKGVDGFRLDVINYISKSGGLPDGHPFIGELMGFTGIEHYFYGPRLHQYLKEMQEEAFAPYDAFSVGETPGIGMKMGKLLTDPGRGELDMMFSFDHLETSGHARFDIYEYDLNYYKKYIIDWMEHYADTSWMSLFYDNHDNPRMLSKIDHSHKYRQILAKLLGLIQMTLKGTPFLFQGQELGMVNKQFKDIRDLRDVESINKYQELCQNMPAEEAFRHILAGSRDHARTPVQWTAAAGCGFTEGRPWIGSDGDEAVCNAKDQQKDRDSVLAFYRALIALRRSTPVFIYGDIHFTHKKKKNLLSYTRSFNKESYYVVCNLGAAERTLPSDVKGEVILSNYRGNYRKLRAYESRIYRL